MEPPDGTAVLHERATSFQASLGDKCLEARVDPVVVSGPHIDDERVKTGLKTRLGDFFAKVARAAARLDLGGPRETALA